MTTKELNTACRKLRYEYYRMSFANQNEGFEWMEKVCNYFCEIYNGENSFKKVIWFPFSTTILLIFTMIVFVSKFVDLIRRNYFQT